MRIGAGRTMSVDDADDPTQRIGRGCVAVQHAESLTIVLPHSDFEAVRTGVRIGHRTADLETADFASQHAVFDRRARSGFDDGGFERHVFGRDIARFGERLRHGFDERAVVAMPHRHPRAELRGATSEQSGGAGGDEVHVVHFVT